MYNRILILKKIGGPVLLLCNDQAQLTSWTTNYRKRGTLQDILILENPFPLKIKCRIRASYNKLCLVANDL